MGLEEWRQRKNETEIVFKKIRERSLTYMDNKGKKQDKKKIEKLGIIKWLKGGTFSWYLEEGNKSLKYT